MPPGSCRSGQTSTSPADQSHHHWSYARIGVREEQALAVGDTEPNHVATCLDDDGLVRTRRFLPPHAFFLPGGFKECETADILGRTCFFFYHYLSFPNDDVKSPRRTSRALLCMFSYYINYIESYVLQQSEVLPI